VSAPEQVTTEDLRTGMRVTVGDATVTVTAITPVGRGARVEFSDGTSATVGRGKAWVTAL
jgi:hypothetical protein